MLTALDVGNKTRIGNVKQPMIDDKRMKMPLKDLDTEESILIKKMAADISIMKKDLAELSNMKVEMRNLKMQLRDSKQNLEI